MTLLIVDDEILSVQSFLVDIDKERVGVDQILTANSYSQAVNLFLEQPVDILLCDIEMPFGSGLDLVEWVKGRFSETLCILVTCHSEFTFAKQAVTLRCFEYILKPVDRGELNQVLGHAVTEILSRREKEFLYEYGKQYFSVAEKRHGCPEEKQGDTVDWISTYILQHLDEELKVSELAKQAFVSPDHLSRLFKKKYQMSLNEYISYVRLKTAKYMLENTELSVAAVGASVGMGNYSYFIKQFKKTYGKTPREYQMELRKEIE